MSEARAAAPHIEARASRFQILAIEALGARRDEDAAGRCPFKQAQPVGVRADQGRLELEARRVLLLHPRW